MIDFHSHILPGIDDGSRDPEMTRQMLASSRVQGVTVQLATPHFYADRMRPAEFLARRAAAYARIREAAEQENVRILCGAEVAFFRNIGEAEALDALLIENTDLLLLEMPFRAWNERDRAELRRIRERGITPVIAHAERFLGWRGNRDCMETLAGAGAVMQVNAGALLQWRTRRAALKLFRSGLAQLLASDCHNLSSRPQNLESGRSILEKKLGKETVAEVDRRGEALLGTKFPRENKELFTAYGQR